MRIRTQRKVLFPRLRRRRCGYLYHGQRNGNGFPVAGIIIAPHLQPKHGMLGTTFGGNHLACAAALAVLEVIEQENLIANAAETGNYLIGQLKKIRPLQKVRGKGLMIGFDLPDNLKDLRKNLLFEQRIFTGEARPNTIRLLSSLAFRKKDPDQFLEPLQEHIHIIESATKVAK